MNSAIIFDIAMIALLIAVALHYKKRGFVAGLVGFVGNLVSLGGALLLSNHTAPLLFSRFFQGGLVEKIEGVLTVNQTVSAHEIIEMYAGFLPESLKEGLVSGAEKILGHVGTAPEIASRLVEGVIAPLLTPLIAIVVFFLAFTICRVAVSLLVAVLTNLNRIPLLGGMNQTLGLVMGLLAGAVDLYLVLCGVWALIVITGGGIPFLNETVLADSYLYMLFERINPFC